MSGAGNNFDLTAEERAALIGLLRRALDEARYPLSRRYDPIKAILAKLEPPATKPELPPPLRPGDGADAWSGAAAIGSDRKIEEGFVCILPAPALLQWSLAWWDQIAPLIQTFMVTITGGVAIAGLTTWRRQISYKRKAEIAEQVLIDFYRVRDVLLWVRTPAFLNTEVQSRKGDDHAMFFIPIDRLTRESELFSRINAHRYVYGTYFGMNNLSPFDDIKRIHSSIRQAAETLIETAEIELTGGKDQMLEQLGWGKFRQKPNRPDKTDRQVEAAVSAVEALCRPVLAERRWGVWPRTKRWR